MALLIFYTHLAVLKEFKLKSFQISRKLKNYSFFFFSEVSLIMQTTQINMNAFIFFLCFLIFFPKKRNFEKMSVLTLSEMSHKISV